MVEPVGVSSHVLLTGFGTGWLSVLADAVLAASGALYVAALLRLRHRGRSWPAATTACFLAGLVVLFVALCSGLARYDDDNFSAHVVQHILLMMVGPPLVVLGRPLTLLLQATDRRSQRAGIALLHSQPVRLLTSSLSVLVYFGVMWGYFVTGWYQASVRSNGLHAVSHAVFLLAGLCYWQYLVGPDRLGRRASHLRRTAALVVSMPIEMYLGFALHASSTSLGPGTTAASTRAGGEIFWWLSMLVSGVALAIAIGQWVLEDERAARRADRMAAGNEEWGYPEPSLPGSGQGASSWGRPARAR